MRIRLTEDDGGSRKSDKSEKREKREKNVKRSRVSYICQMTGPF